LLGRDTSGIIEAMIIETSNLESRAIVHAALGDVRRLRIVDLLAAGDASPGELGSRLGLSSNLLAHHLRTLESAGLIRRKASDADGRRSYLQLLRRALPAEIPYQPRRANRIVFVCAANTARSQLALALWKTLSGIPGESAGTRPAAAIDPRALATAHRHGLTLTERHPQHIDDIATSGDLIVTVCDSAHESLAGRADLHWSIADPVAEGGRKAFERAYAELDARITDLAIHLAAS
jgi:protein-tyrosine-phosphatase/DNA-binding HxlR family transcriptional regulator